MTPLAIVSIITTGLSLVMSIWLVIVSSSARELQVRLQDKQREAQDAQALAQAQQQRLQTQQEQLNVGNALAQQVGPQVMQALGQAVVNNKNEKIRELLKKHGYEIQNKPEEAAATPAANAPAAPKP